MSKNHHLWTRTYSISASKKMLWENIHFDGGRMHTPSHLFLQTVKFSTTEEANLFSQPQRQLLPELWVGFIVPPCLCVQSRLYTSLPELSVHTLGQSSESNEWKFRCFCRKALIWAFLYVTPRQVMNWSHMYGACMILLSFKQRSTWSS